MSDIADNDELLTPFLKKMFDARKEEGVDEEELSAFAKQQVRNISATTVEKTAEKKSAKPSARNVYNNGVEGEQGKLKYEGLPFRGTPGTFKHDDPDNLKPQLGYEGHVAQFDLSKEEDMQKYNILCQKICEGSILLSFEEKVYDNDIKSWRILVRYADMYYANPQG